MKSIHAVLLLLVPVSLVAGASGAAAQSGAPYVAAPAAHIQEQPPMPAPPVFAAGPPPASYVIGPQDVLKISVVDEGPELQNQSAVVGSDGLISFWALRNILAGGKTLREVQDKIAALLADGYIKNPVVRAEIDKYKRRGDDHRRSPNAEPNSDDGIQMLLEALADAGGQSGRRRTKPRYRIPAARRK